MKSILVTFQCLTPSSSVPGFFSAREAFHANHGGSLSSEAAPPKLGDSADLCATAAAIAGEYADPDPGQPQALKVGATWCWQAGTGFCWTATAHPSPGVYKVCKPNGPQCDDDTSECGDKWRLVSGHGTNNCGTPCKDTHTNPCRILQDKHTDAPGRRVLCAVILAQ